MIWALSLPGRVAPMTSAEFIKETLYHILKEKTTRLLHIICIQELAFMAY